MRDIIATYITGRNPTGRSTKKEGTQGAKGNPGRLDRRGQGDFRKNERVEREDHDFRISLSTGATFGRTQSVNPGREKGTREKEKPGGTTKATNTTKECFKKTFG